MERVDAVDGAGEVGRALTPLDDRRRETGPDLFHGWKNIGVDEAFIVNMPSSRYDHEAPDALDLPYESEMAPAIVPFRWS